MELTVSAGRPAVPGAAERAGNAVRAAALPRVAQVSVVTDAAAFAGLRREWGALLDESTAGPFNAWEWLYPWYRRIGQGRTPWILTARGESGELLGLLPLALEHRRCVRGVVRRLAFLGETHVGSDYLDVVARSGLEQPVREAFAQAVTDARSEWDLLDLSDLASDSPALEVFGRWLGGVGLSVGTTPRFVCPFERFAPGETFEAFLRRTARRDNFLRRRKWLMAQEGYRLVRTEAPAEVALPLGEFFRLHALRWREDGGSQGIRGAGVEAFHRDATYLLAQRGRLRLYTMWVGGQAVASVYGIRHRDTFIYFQSGYDPSWANRSVGLVLVGETFREAIEGGCAEYDFLRGTEGYKSDWTTRQRTTVALRAYAPASLGHWLDWEEAGRKELRGAIKAVLPQRLVESVRRIRRRRSAL